MNWIAAARDAREGQSKGDDGNQVTMIKNDGTTAT